MSVTTNERRQRAYRRAAALGRWSDRLPMPALLSVFSIFVIAIARDAIDLWMFAGFLPCVVLIVVAIVLGSWGTRIRRRTDADLKRVPWHDMEQLAYWLYSRLSVQTDAPCSFERMARVWLARGQLEELPYPSFRRKLTIKDIAQLPPPLFLEEGIGDGPEV